MRIIDGRYPLSEGETPGNDICFIVNDDAVIEKVFLKRLEKPTIVRYGNEIRVSLPEGTEEYDIEIDGNAGDFYVCEEEGEVSLDLKKSSVTSGRHEIAVVVRGKDSKQRDLLIRLRKASRRA